jgi:hypothetical protein
MRNARRVIKCFIANDQIKVQHLKDLIVLADDVR